MADAVGYLALGIMVFGLIRKDSSNLLLLISAGVFLWGIHYWLLGSSAGAIVHFIAGVGVFLAHATFDASVRTRLSCVVVFAALGVGASLYREVNLANSVAALGCIVMTASQYIFRDQKMRQGFLAGETIFFVFALVVGSVPGMLVTVANTVAGVIGLMRVRHSRGRAQALEAA
jgi:hypothetical protein